MTKPILLAAAKGAALVTLVLLAALLFRPVSSRVALDAYVIALGGVALLGFVRTTRVATGGRGGASELEEALRPHERSTERPRELERVEREVDLALANAFYLHYRLRPLARQIAQHRLGVRRGVPLDSAEGRAAVGVPDGERVLGLIHLGQPRQEKKPPERAPSGDYVTYLP